MSLHVHEFGPPGGPPILALHGVSGHGGRFADLARRLGHYRVIAPDLRGHGRSTSLPPWSLDRHVEDLVGVLDRYAPAPLPVVGHSLGGVLAVRLARRAAGRIDRMILLEPGTLSPQQPELALANAERMRIDVSYVDRAEARADRVRNGWQTVPADLVDDELDAHLVRTADGRWEWRYCRSALVAVLGDLVQPVPSPTVPTMLVIGRTSRAVTPEYRQSCVDALGDELALIELDGGHLIYYECPQQVATHIATFLR